MLVWHLSEGATAMSDPETTAYWPATTETAVLNTSIGQLLRDAAAAVPDRLALVEGIDPALARRWTYRELLADAERVATALLSDFEPGARVAVYSPNRWEWALLQLGAALAGMVLVTVNPALRKRELRYVLEQSRSCALFYSGEYRGQPSGARSCPSSGSRSPSRNGTISCSARRPRGSSSLWSSRATRPRSSTPRARRAARRAACCITRAPSTRRGSPAGWRACRTATSGSTRCRCSTSAAA